MFVCPTCGQRSDRAGYCANEGQPLAETDDELLGTEIERYRLARKIGEGGMGRVYLAVQPAIGARVAIKILSDECRRTPELLERFFAEARAVNLIRHENITSVLDMAVLPNGQPFIVMEFVEGQTLAEIVRATQAPLGGVIQVIGEMLSALAAAHAIGIVHRDLKPDNIIVTVEGHAKVLDFGIAKLAPGLRDVGSQTKTGAILGTPAYMAPEQISGAGNVDARTDVYAAGVVLFEAVTGRQPFLGATIFDLMKAHIEQAPPSPKLFRPDLPDAIEQVILVALAKDPAQRFQSAAAMSQALAHAGAVLTQDQWKPLSSRAGVITPRVSANYTPPQQVVDYRSTAVTPGGKTEAKQRRMGAVIALVAAVLLGFGITMFVIATKSADAPNLAGSATSDAAAAVVLPDATPLIAQASDAAVAVEPPPARTPVHVAGKPNEHPPPPVAKTAPRDAGPTIVGGGSAADHGVIIGDNVHIGSGVVIGGGTPPPPTGGPNSATSRADYNAKRFDPIAYLPKATALARQLAPDAMLTRFDFDPVFSDGHVDLTTGRDHEYTFRSTVRSVRPTDVPRNVPVERPCIIHVEIEASGATASVRATDDCTARLVKAPRCTFASVWKQASAAGTPGDVVARIAWLSDEKWFFDVDLEGKGGGVSTFPDRCP